MTGKEWAVCNDPLLMIDVLCRRMVSERRWRLFVAAFWRWRADFLGESRDEVLDSVAITEQFAETGRLPRGLRTSLSDDRIFFAAEAHHAARNTAVYAYRGPTDQSLMLGLQADLLRELFGNPFRTPVFDPRWRTSDVLGLARAIYEDRAFERMPILADALMDAGCEHEAIIGHCRGHNGHVRGCWVLDLVLGKDKP